MCGLRCIKQLPNLNIRSLFFHMERPISPDRKVFIYVINDTYRDQFNLKGKLFDLQNIMHSASVFYKNIINTQSEKCENLRFIWQMKSWRDIISSTGWDIRSTFTHYKTIQVYYYTPLKLFRRGLIQYKKFWKCKEAIGTFSHAIRECSMVLPFWK